MAKQKMLPDPLNELPAEVRVEIRRREAAIDRYRRLERHFTWRRVRESRAAAASLVCAQYGMSRRTLQEWLKIDRETIDPVRLISPHGCKPGRIPEDAKAAATNRERAVKALLAAQDLPRSSLRRSSAERIATRHGTTRATLYRWAAAYRRCRNTGLIDKRSWPPRMAFKRASKRRTRRRSSHRRP